MTNPFNPDLATGGHTYYLGHIFCWKCVSVGMGFAVFFFFFF